MRVARLFALSLATLSVTATAGCHLYFGVGDDGDDQPPPLDGGDPFPDAGDVDAPQGFTLPTAPTRANRRVGDAWQDDGLADWACLDTPTSDLPSTGSIQLSGRVLELGRQEGVGAAAIVAYAPSTSAIVGEGTSLSGAATRGQYAMTLAMLPATSRRYTFVLSALDHVGTYVLERYVPPGPTATTDLAIVSHATLASYPAAAGLTRPVNTATVFGAVVDCRGRRVSNAVVIASRTRSAFDPVTGVQSLYHAAGATSLPAPPSEQPVSNQDGRFLLLGVPPITAGVAVQVYGYRTPDELALGNLTLLGQVWSPAQSDTAVLADLEPRRRP